MTNEIKYFFSPLTTDKDLSHNINCRNAFPFDKISDDELVFDLYKHKSHTSVQDKIIFPPLLPTITLDFPAFTFNPLPSRLALQSATRLPSCSIVGAIIARSSAYSNSERQTTSRLAGNNIHDSSKQQWTQY